MAYIGVQPADAYTSFAVQHFTTSATDTFTLDFPVANENEIALFINNVRQEPGSAYAYTASGTTLTLSSAITGSDSMYCVFIGKAVQTVTPNLNPVTIDSGTVATFNRTTSDGDIVELQKDGTSVGVLGVNSSDNLYLAGGSGGTKGIYFSGSSMSPATTGGATLDNGVDIGASGVRWKDLYLGGSVYLGGVTSANALDDYEEGTFTPVITDGAANTYTGGYQEQTGTYTKIGRMVYIYLLLNINDGATQLTTNGLSSTQRITVEGLPFTTANVQFNALPVYFQEFQTTVGSTFGDVQGVAQNSTTKIQFYFTEDSGNQRTFINVSGFQGGSHTISMNFTYYV